MGRQGSSDSCGGYAPVTVSLLAVVVLGRVLGLWKTKNISRKFS